MFIVVRIVSGRVEDRYANCSVGVDYNEVAEKETVSITILYYIFLPVRVAEE